MNRLLLVVLISVSCLGAASDSPATDFRWEPNVLDPLNWDDPRNWRNLTTNGRPDGMPGDGDEASFNINAPAVRAGGDRLVSNISIEGVNVTFDHGHEFELTGNGTPAGLELLGINSTFPANNPASLRVTEGTTGDRTTVRVPSGEVALGVRSGTGRSSLIVDGNAGILASDLRLGNTGAPSRSASLRLINGGDVTGLGGSASINVNGPDSLVEVDGAGSELTGFLRVEINSEDSEVEVANGGLLEAIIFRVNGSDSTARVRSGGTVSVGNIGAGPNGLVSLQGGELRFFEITSGSRPLPEFLHWTTGALRVQDLSGATLGQTMPNATSLGNGLVLDSGKVLDVANTLSINEGGLLSLQGGALQGSAQLNGGTLVSNAPLNLDVVPIGGAPMRGTIVGDVANNIPTRFYSVPREEELAILGGLDLEGSLSVGILARLSVIDSGSDPVNLGRLTTLRASSELLTSNGAEIEVGETLTATGRALIRGDFTNNGTVNGPVTTSSFGVLRFNDNVDGAGNYTGNVEFLQGFSPGNSPAVVELDNVTLAPTSDLLIELGGVFSGEFDRLEVSGDANLGGELVVDLIGGLTPNVGDEFEIIDVAGGLAGEFSGLSEGAVFEATGGQLFSITYFGGDGNDVVLTAVPVPEPSSSLLMLPLLAATAKRRSKTHRTRCSSC